MFLARAQGTDMYQFAYIHRHLDPIKQWKVPLVREHVHCVPGGHHLYPLIRHELREYEIGPDWYRLPAHVAELVPFMMDEILPEDEMYERSRVQEAEYKRAYRARKRTRTAQSS